MLGSDALGIIEDPATGGASGPLGVYCLTEGIFPSGPSVRIVSRQGVKMGRPSEVLIDIGQEGQTITRVEVGGQVVPVLDGRLSL